MQGVIQRAASAVTLAFLLSACSAPPPKAPPPPAVTAAPAIGRTVNQWDEFTGRFEAVDHVLEPKPAEIPANCQNVTPISGVCWRNTRAQPVTQVYRLETRAR